MYTMSLVHKSEYLELRRHVPSKDKFFLLTPCQTIPSVAVSLLRAVWYAKHGPLALLGLGVSSSLAHH